MLKLLVTLSVTLFSQFSMAAFSAEFSSFEVVVVNTDGTPLRDMRVRYQTWMTEASMCGGGRGNPFYIGTPCWKWVAADEGGYVVTDHNGRARIPAVSASSYGLSSHDARLVVSPAGVDVPLNTPSGTYRCMPLTEYVDSYYRSDDRQLDENVAADLAQTGLVFKYKDSQLRNATYEAYVKWAEQSAQQEYSKYGEEYVTSPFSTCVRQ
ncbi:hypothetical protein [Bdellovibrio sp. HCB209]|uniref:hypothetical protein n=1 Tax=Bdellovibrio sp. HCB209 TaxID=3394354 RepID=UPI0039B4CCC9